MIALMLPLIMSSPTDINAIDRGREDVSTKVSQSVFPVSGALTQLDRYQHYFHYLLSGERANETVEPEKLPRMDPLTCQTGATTLWRHAFPEWPVTAFSAGGKISCSQVRVLATFFPLLPQASPAQVDVEMADDKSASSFISILNLTLPATRVPTPTKKSLAGPQVVAGVAALPDDAFIFPLPSDIVVTSPYGMRYHPVTHQFMRHEGVDLRAPVNSAVITVADGEVAETGYGPVTGFYITVDHADGWSSRYLHLNKIDVHKGDRVLRGNVIALSGATGRTNGPHLHLELSHHQQLVNPMDVLSASTLTPNAARAQNPPAAEENRIVIVPVDMTPVITLVSGEGESMQIAVRVGKKTVFYSPREPVETEDGVWRIVKRYGKYTLVKQSPKSTAE